MRCVIISTKIKGKVKTDMHRIKKYANRKMYDTTTQRNVTLDDIAELVESGETITIIDNASGEEITQEILSQLVSRALDGQARKLPLSVLVGLMRKGSGGLVDFSKKYISLWRGALTYADGELDKVSSLIGRPQRPDADQDPSLSDENADAQEQLLSLLDARIEQQTERILNQQQAETDKRFSMLEGDITRIQTRLETLERLLSQALKIESKR